MTRNERLEKQLWDVGIAELEESALHELVAYLADRFRVFIGREIEISEINVEKGVGGSCEVFLRNACEMGFDVEWDCMIHIRLPQEFEDQQTQAYASLLAFSNGQRLGLQQHDGRSVMFMTYKPIEGANANWGGARWHEDDYGEWEGYERPTWYASPEKGPNTLK